MANTLNTFDVGESRCNELVVQAYGICSKDSKRVKILASQKRIIYTPTNSFYQVLSAEAYSKHGFNIHGVVFDERQAKREKIGRFVSCLEQMDGPLTAFNEDDWYSLVDYATVYSREDIRFTFKNGMEIKA